MDEDEVPDRTSTPLGEEPLDLSGEESGSSSPELSDEEAIFSLLFEQCDSEKTGLVDVERLVQFIRSVQMGEGTSELYDSHDDVSKVQYNLQLLKAMLECNAVDGCVDQATYSHIIKMWVKDVRGRSSSSPPPSPPLEVSQLSDSGDDQQEGSWSYGSGDNSLEASGGHSSQHSLDRIELINSVADLKLDNKRLQERNQQLQIQMESSEENLKEIQAQNEKLKHELKSAQTALGRLEELERDNSDLTGFTETMKKQCNDLHSQMAGLERQLMDTQGELSMVQTQLTNADVDKGQVEDENRALQLLLVQKEEMLNHQQHKQTQFESQLHELQHHQSELSQTIADLNEANENLRTENADLQAHQPSPQGKPMFPLSSTPYRHSAPSWHEELSAHEPLMNRGSPIRPISSDMRMDSESFSRLLKETNVKINHTHNLIVREISDMINQPSPLPSRHSGESSHTLLSERFSDKSFHAFESKLSEILRQKKQLQNENVELVAQIEDLNSKLRQLKEQLRAVPPQSASVKSEEVAIQAVGGFMDESGVQTEPVDLSRSQVITHSIEAVDWTEPDHMTDKLEEARRRHEELADQFAVLESRAVQMEGVRGGSVLWRMCTGVAVMLLLTVLVLLLLVGMIMLHDAFDSCGPYCPHSPMTVLYTLLDSHLHYQSTSVRPV